MARESGGEGKSGPLGSRLGQGKNTEKGDRRGHGKNNFGVE